jgi:hypothetical protein
MHDNAEKFKGAVAPIAITYATTGTQGSRCFRPGECVMDRIRSIFFRGAFPRPKGLFVPTSSSGLTDT